jgi:membrane fusion protein (multidrug efflux system)
MDAETTLYDKRSFDTVESHDVRTEPGQTAVPESEPEALAPSTRGTLKARRKPAPLPIPAKTESENRHLPVTQDVEPVAAKPAPAATPSRRLSRKVIAAGAALLALAAAGWYGYDYVTVGQYMISTDDAYVGADMSLIAPQVAAYVSEVDVTDNQHVKTGDILVRLDDGDYRLAAEQAQAKLATQKASLETFNAQIVAAQTTADQTRAEAEATNADLVKAEADFGRTSKLVKQGVSSRSSLDDVTAARDAAAAQVKAKRAAIETANANVGVLKAQRAEAGRVVKELEVAVAKAERDLSFTIIRAPFDGVVGNKSVQVGDYVTPGKRLAAVVPLDKVYVDANFKETQLASVVPGQKAEVRVDALDGAAIEGTVESLAPASGSQFSLLPPENATGNFTKIVQRVPVRIAIPADAAQDKLRPGLSVIVDIDTRTTPKGPSQTAMK